MENDVDSRGPPGYYADKGYALSGKIMISAIIILLFVVILMVFLHLYARWYLIRARRRHVRRHRRRHRRTHFAFYVDPANPNHIPNSPSRGLDASVLKSLSVFVFSSKTHPDGLDCAVCLSEFEENESGRMLPKCNHSFHIGCIDMWFHTHATCPLCRSPVELVAAQPENPTVQTDNPIDFVASVTEPGPSAEENESSGWPDPEASRGLTHTSSLMLSFKRMLSRDKRANGSECGVDGGSVNDSDIERGREEIQR